MKKILKKIGWWVGGILLVALVLGALNNPTIEGMSSAGLAALLLIGLASGVGALAHEQLHNAEYEHLSVTMRVVKILFYWVGGSALAAGLVTDLIKSALPIESTQLWTFLFVFILAAAYSGAERKTG